MSKGIAVVMGRNYTSRLGMIRSIGMAGYEVIDVLTDPKSLYKDHRIDSSSRYVKQAVHIPEPGTEQLLAFLRKVISQASDRPLLLPTDDYTASVLDSAYDELRDKALIPGCGGQGRVLYWMDKLRQKEEARRCGLKVAEGWESLWQEGQGYAVPEGLRYPCFAKAAVSVKGNKRMMRRCDSEQDVQKYLAELERNGAGSPVIFEEFIRIEKEYAVLGTSYHGEVLIPDIIEARTVHLGVTAVGEIRAIDPALAGQLAGFIRSIGFEGMFDIDLYESGGQIYFNELNLRIGASGWAVTAAGVNLPAIWAECVTGGSTDPLAPKPGQLQEGSFASEKVCLQKYFADDMSWADLKSVTGASRYLFVASEDDPAPYRAMMKQARVNRMKRGVKKLASWAKPAAKKNLRRVKEK